MNSGWWWQMWTFRITTIFCIIVGIVCHNGMWFVFAGIYSFIDVVLAKTMYERYLAKLSKQEEE